MPRCSLACPGSRPWSRRLKRGLLGPHTGSHILESSLTRPEGQPLSNEMTHTLAGMTVWPAASRSVPSRATSLSPRCSLARPQRPSGQGQLPAPPRALLPGGSFLVAAASSSIHSAIREDAAPPGQSWLLAARGMKRRCRGVYVPGGDETDARAQGTGHRAQGAGGRGTALRGRSGGARPVGTDIGSPAQCSSGLRCARHPLRGRSLFIPRT